MLKVLILFLFVTAATVSGKNKPIFAGINYSTSISRTTVDIIWDFYVKTTSTLTISRAAVGNSTYVTQSDIVNEVLWQTKTKVIVVIEEYWSLQPNVDRFFNILFVDSYAGFRLIFKNMKENIFDYTGFYTIVLTESFRNQYNAITSILKDCWLLQITNVIVIVSLNTRTAVYTYFPYSTYHCEAVAPVILNYFIDNAFLYENENFFPDKAQNMHRCPLTVATYNVTPYMFLIPRKDGSIFTDGIDGITFRVLSQRLNFTPIVLVPPNNEMRGMINEKAHSRSTGAMKMILEGTANITIGSIAYNEQRSRILSASFPYFHSALIFAVPHGKPYTPLENLFFPFKYIIWSIICSTFIFGLFVCISLKFIKRKRRDFVVGPNNHTPFMNMLNACLGGGLTTLPTRNFARYILSVWLLGCIVLRSAYQSALFDFLQRPKIAAPVEKLDDLIASDYPLIMRKVMRYLFEAAPKLHAHIQDSPSVWKAETQGFPSLLEPTFKGAFLTTEATVAYYNREHKLGTVQASSEQLYLVPFSIFFRKHSCLTAPINEQINSYTSSGLLHNWISKYIEHKYLLMPPRKKNQEHRPLEMIQLSGAFQLGIYALIGSIAVFILELCSTRSETIRIVLEIFTY